MVQKKDNLRDQSGQFEFKIKVILEIVNKEDNYW
jgi:hypothetical protein